MIYTITQFKKDFSDDNTCLDYIFKARFGEDYLCPRCNKTGFYRIKKRKCYCCARCGYQVHPTSGTIFHKSDTKLTNWFYAIYLMSKSKHGVSAKELERHLGVTYKTAWRIGKQIRSLMKQDTDKLNGIVEADETYIGGVKQLEKSQRRDTGKSTVMGIVQRGGKVKSKHIPDQQTHTLLDMLAKNVKFGSHLITDENSIYRKAPRLGLFHDSIKHRDKEYVRGDIHTNTIEGYWSFIKRSISGCYVSVSPKYLQSYLDEYSYHYNHKTSVFHDLLARLCEQHGSKGQKMPSFVDIPVS